MYKGHDEKGSAPRLIGISRLIGEDVYNHRGEDLAI
jgi:hypothetical protein